MATSLPPAYHLSLSPAYFYPVSPQSALSQPSAHPQPTLSLPSAYPQPTLILPSAYPQLTFSPPLTMPSSWPQTGQDLAASLNEKLKIHRGADKRTGVQPVRLPLSAEQIRELELAVRSGFANARKGYSCTWVHRGTGLVVQAKGWNNFPKVNAEHNASEQYKHTCSLHPAEKLWEHCLVLPHLADIIAYCRTLAPALSTVLFVHLLDQASAQTSFSWHTDNNPQLGDGYEDVRRSFVFSLTAGESSMMVAGRVAAFTYEGAGSGCAFNASLWHSSVQAVPATLKVAVFMGSTT